MVSEESRSGKRGHDALHIAVESLVEVRPVASGKLRNQRAAAGETWASTPPARLIRGKRCRTVCGSSKPQQNMLAINSSDTTSTGEAIRRGARGVPTTRSRRPVAATDAKPSVDLGHG